MDVLREREVKDSLDRQLADERKLRGELQEINSSFSTYKVIYACSFLFLLIAIELQLQSHVASVM